MGQATQVQVWCLLLVGLAVAAAALLHSACLFLPCRQQPPETEAGVAVGVSTRAAFAHRAKGMRRAENHPKVRVICRKPLVEFAGSCQLPIFVSSERNLRKEAIDLSNLIIKTVKNRRNKTSFNLVMEDVHHHVPHNFKPKV